MKYNTFRGILWAAGAVVGVLVLTYSCGNSSSSSSSSDRPTKANSFANTNNTSALSAQEIMQVFEAPSGGKPKLKDAFSRSTTKVNMYDDKAVGKWMRAKVDYDRDEKDDEKWERDADTGQITRQVSVNDDGVFGPKQVWDGAAFIQEGANTPALPANAATPTNAPGADASAAGMAGALSVQDIMRVFEGSTNGQPKLKDAFSSSPTKVNMYDDTSSGKWGRAKIDYDRDEKDDEKWERDPATGQITRMISANDDGSYGPKQTWTGSSFVQ